MRPLQGYREEGMCWKLNKCLYSLKQSTHKWYREFLTTIAEKGFQACNFDPCIFVHQEHEIYISVFVDDIIRYSDSTPEAEALISFLKQRFEITDLGEATWILGLKITYSLRGISLSQQQYIEKC